MRVDQESPVEPGQRFTIDLFRPEDAAGIASLFYSIYGPEYPFDTYYYPERITEENEKGNIHSLVARTPKGDVIGHAALYRSSPPNPNLFEGGQYMILKEYRNTSAIYRLNKYLGEELIKLVNPDGVFGEVVCTHITTQKAGAILGFKDFALELELMPARLYERENITSSARVSCVIQFRSHRDRPHEVFIPAAYREQIDFILNDTGITRTMRISTHPIPSDSASESSTSYFSHANVARINVASAGADFGTIVAQCEQQGREQGIEVLQVFISLEKPWVSAAIELLRQKGYFFCGYVPRWFDYDGILMQKGPDKPDFGAVSLYSDKAKKLLEYVLEDWTRASAVSAISEQ